VTRTCAPVRDDRIDRFVGDHDLFVTAIHRFRDVDATLASTHPYSGAGCHIRWPREHSHNRPTRYGLIGATLIVPLH
jgi:hypothetical protein